MEELNPLEEGLSKIEVNLRQLKIQYDMFFSGVSPRQPFESRKEIEILLYEMRKLPMQRFSDRFRYNTLSSRFQVMVEKWGKMIRAKEEGRLTAGLPGFGLPAARSLTARASSFPESGSGSFRFHDPSSQDELCRMFYDEYVKTSRKAMPGKKRLPYNKFQRQIQAKTEAMKKRASCDSVACKVETKGDRVVLKLRPSKTEK